MREEASLLVGKGAVCSQPSVQQPALCSAASTLFSNQHTLSLAASPLFSSQPSVYQPALSLAASTLFSSQPSVQQPAHPLFSSQPSV